MRLLRRVVEPVVRGFAWAADYLFVVRWQLRSVLRRRPAWADVSPEASGVPVVLIPGIFESWRFLEPLGRRLADAGHPVHVVSLGLNNRPVAVLARKVGLAIERSQVDAAVVVAHSKGGLIGKQLMLDERRRSAGGGPSPRVAGMVAINTPFGGSRLARLIPLSSVRDLRPSALQALSAQRGVDERITSVFAAWDPHVPEGSELVGAINIRLRQRGHFRVLGIPAVQEIVLTAVERMARPVASGHAAVGPGGDDAPRPG